MGFERAFPYPRSSALLEFGEPGSEGNEVCALFGFGVVEASDVFHRLVRFLRLDVFVCGSARKVVVVGALEFCVVEVSDIAPEVFKVGFEGVE